MIGLINLHKADRFPEGSSFWFSYQRPSKFSVAVVLNAFCVVFHGIFPQIWFSLQKSFTSDAMKLSQKNRISGSKSFSVYTVMKFFLVPRLHLLILIWVGFLGVCFEVVVVGGDYPLLCLKLVRIMLET